MHKRRVSSKKRSSGGNNDNYAGKNKKRPHLIPHDLNYQHLHHQNLEKYMYYHEHQPQWKYHLLRQN